MIILNQFKISIIYQNYLINSLFYHSMKFYKIKIMAKSLFIFIYLLFLSNLLL